MRLIFLALLDRALVAVEVIEVCKALHHLALELTIRHGVTQDDGGATRLAQEGDDAARRLALAAAGAHGRNRDNRAARREHRVIHIEGAKRRASPLDEGAPFLNVAVRHVGVGEDDLVDALLGDKLCEPAFGVYGDAVRVSRARQRGRIAALLDMRNLGGRECDHVDVLSVPVTGVEHVKITSRSAHDENSTHHPPLQCLGHEAKA